MIQMCTLRNFIVPSLLYLLLPNLLSFLDTEDLYTVIYHELFHEHGLPEYTWELKQRLMGRKAIEAAQIVIDETGLQLKPEEWVELVSKKSDTVFPSAELMPGELKLVCICWMWKCRGRAVKSTEFKLWCCWFESLTMTLKQPLLRPLDGMLSPCSHVLCNACKRTQCAYRKGKGSPQYSWLWLLYAP